MRRKTHQPQRHGGQVGAILDRDPMPHDQAHVVVEQRRRGQRVRGHRGVIDEADVGLAAFHQRHHLRRTAAHDRQIDVLAAADELRHHLGHEVVAERMHRSQPHRALRHAFALAHRLQRLVDAAIGRQDAIEQPRARLGQFDAAAGAHEQRLAHVGFQRRQLAAQAGLGLVQVLGGPRQRFQFRDPHEIAQLPVRRVHAASPASPSAGPVVIQRAHGGAPDSVHQGAGRHYRDLR